MGAKAVAAAVAGAGGDLTSLPRTGAEIVHLGFQGVLVLTKPKKLNILNIQPQGQSDAVYLIGGNHEIGRTFTDADVNLSTEEITMTAHGLLTGDGPYRLGANQTPPTGLGTGIANIYWVIKVDANTIQLASTRDDALSGSAINLSALNEVTLDFADGDVNTTTDAVTVTAHGILGHTAVIQKVTLTSTGTLPAGLALATPYFMFRVDTNQLAFYVTESDAMEDTNRVDITAAVGTGTHSILVHHSFGWADGFAYRPADVLLTLTTPEIVNGLGLLGWVTEKNPNLEAQFSSAAFFVPDPVITLAAGNSGQYFVRTTIAYWWS